MTDTKELKRRAKTVVRAKHAPALVAAYFDPSSGFAGAMFDGLDRGRLLADNPRSAFSVDDIAAVSLLDVRFGPLAVRSLIGSDDFASCLNAVPSTVPLWRMSDKTYEAANQLWSQVVAIPGVGATRASKLLSRKRPHLIPIVDSVILGALGLDADVWLRLAEVLDDDCLQGDIDALRPDGVSRQISTLRLLDVVVWMSCSRSTAAVKVQLRVGAVPTRSL